MEEDPKGLGGAGLGSSWKGNELDNVKMASTSKLCRTCLNNSNYYTHIYEDHFFTGCLLYEVMNELFQLEVNMNDGFLEYLCQECYLKIRDFKKFKIYAHRVKNKFQLIREGKKDTQNDSSNNVSQYSEETKEDRNIGNTMVDKETLEQHGSLDTEDGDSSESEVQFVTEISANASPTLKDISKHAKDLEVKSPKREKVDKEALEQYGSLDTEDGDSSEVQFLTAIAANTSPPAPKDISNHAKDLEVTSPKSKKAGGKQGKNAERKRKLNESCKCPLCARRFRKVSEIAIHLKKIHKQKYVCHICAMQVAKKYEFMKHLSKCVKSKHKILKKKEMAKKHICHTCNLTFYSLKKLKKHELSHQSGPTFPTDLHSKGESFHCDVCGQSLFCRASLEEHKLNHKLLKFSCIFCGKNFRRKKQLNKHNCVHLRVHTVNYSTESLVANISASLDMKNCKVAPTGKNASDLEKIGSNVCSSSYHELPNIRPSDLNQPDPSVQGSAASDSFAQFKNNITPTDIDMHTSDINKAGFSHSLDHKNVHIDLSNCDIERADSSNSLQFEVSSMAYTPSDNGEVTETGLSNNSSNKRHSIANEDLHLNYTDIIQTKYYASPTLKENKKPKVEPRFHCKDCDEKFFIQANLVYHRKIHAGLNLFHSVPLSSENPTKERNKTKQNNEKKQTDKKKQMNKKKGKVKMGAKSNLFGKEQNIEENVNIPVEPTYGCDLCSKKFLFSSTLEVHRLYHERLKNERPVTCDICGAVLGGLKLYVRHLKTHGRRKRKKNKNPIEIYNETSIARGDLDPKSRTKNKNPMNTDNEATILGGDLDTRSHAKHKNPMEIYNETSIAGGDLDPRSDTKNKNPMEIYNEIAGSDLDPRTHTKNKNPMEIDDEVSIVGGDLDPRTHTKHKNPMEIADEVSIVGGDLDPRSRTKHKNPMEINNETSITGGDLEPKTHTKNKNPMEIYNDTSIAGSALDPRTRTKNKNPMEIDDEVSIVGGDLDLRSHTKHKNPMEIDNETSITGGDLEPKTHTKNKNPMEIYNDTSIAGSALDPRTRTKNKNPMEIADEVSVVGGDLDPRSHTNTKNEVFIHGSDLDLKSHTSLLPAVYKSSYSGILGE